MDQRYTKKRFVKNGSELYQEKIGFQQIQVEFARSIFAMMIFKLHLLKVVMTGEMLVEVKLFR